MSARQIAIFGAGAVTAAAVWAMVWPTGDSVESALEVVDQRIERPSTRTAVDIAGWLRDLEAAPDAASRAVAAERIGGLPASAFPGVFDKVGLVEDWRVTLPARLLLSRWAALDGEAAVNWAWLNARSSGRWDQVFREIVTSWAWHRPHELAAWARIQAAAMRSHSLPMTMTLAEVEANDLPVLESGNFRMIGQALMKADLRQGFEVLLLSNSIDSKFSSIAESLHSTGEILEALSAFDCLEAMEPSRLVGYDQMVAMSLLTRWKNLDREDFAKSPYVHLVPDRFPLPADPQLDPVVRVHREWHGEFQEWQNSAPRARPDMSGWSAAKREAWEDFEAMMPAAAEGP